MPGVKKEGGGGLMRRPSNGSEVRSVNKDMEVVRAEGPAQGNFPVFSPSEHFLLVITALFHFNVASIMLA